VAEAFIIEAVRTPTGRNRGRLAGWHPIDLGALVLDEIVARAGVDAASVDDVVFGCVDQVGDQAANVARNCILASSYPESVPGTTVDRQCGSSQQAVHFAAQAVQSGAMDVVVAGGVEVMSRVPIGANAIAGHKAGFGMPYGKGMKARYPGVKWSQFAGAEMLAQRFGLTRERLDEFAAASHAKAAAATDGGRFAAQIVPVDVEVDGEVTTMTADEGIRPGTDTATLAGLKSLSDLGLLTAGSSSQISDGASALLLANEEGVERLGVTPRARVHTMTVVGDDPVEMLGAPIPATARALARAGVVIDDIDLFEVNEAFASVPMAWLEATGANPAKLNVNGGAIALGHPLGASGGRLMTTLLYELERTGGRWGLQTMCEGGGLANCTIVENLR
jgi:acetyl-CoA C-acetyltransferase